MSFRKKFFKNIIILGGYSYTTQIISFLSTIVLSRLLLPEEYGFVALITVFTSFINQFADAGLSYLIIRSDYKNLFQQSIHYLSFIIGVILTITLILLAYPIALFYKNNELILPTIVFSFNFLLGSLIITPYGILSKELKFTKLGIIELSCTTGEILLMIILAFFNLSYWALIIPRVIGNLIRIFIYQAKVSIHFKILNTRYLVVAFRKAKGILKNLIGSNLLNYWARNADNLIIGKFYGAQDLGIYNRAYRILSLVLNIITSLFGKVLYPSLKSHANEGGDINKEYINTLGVISLLNFPVAVILIFFAEPIVRILWSETWIQVAYLLPYVGILILTQTLNSTTGNIFVLYGKEKTLLHISIPTNIVVVGAIALGATISVLHVMRFYTLASVAFDIPFVIYYGFKKSFGFKTRTILAFWIPKIVLSLLMVGSVWLKYKYLTIGLSAVYFIHLVIDQRNDLKNIIIFIRKKYLRRVTK